MYTALYDIWIIIQIAVGYNLIFPIVLFLFYIISGRPKRKSVPAGTHEYDYAIIVTAYEQTDSLPAVVGSILAMNYRNYLVYIVADKCDISKLNFTDERIVLLRPEETLASNTRSHFYAINHFRRQHELLIIIDSDNLVDTNCLNALNTWFQQGYEAVQGIRKAKNLDTVYACLDAARDMYYHFFDGEVLFRIGSSATLAGSGMAFTTSLYRECLEKLDITGAGFDKVLQKEIVSRGKRIAFAEDAVVFDEKTSASDQLVKQRARWINTWFRYFTFGFGLVSKGLSRLDRNRIVFGLVLLRPPLFIFLLLSLAFTVINFSIDTGMFIAWLSAFGCFIAGFAITLAHARPPKEVYRALPAIPKFIFFQVLAMLKIGKANSLSVATRHKHSHSINEVNRRP